MIADFVIEKMSRYIAGGISPRTAAQFTRGELAAIYKGKHHSRDASGAWRVTPPPEALDVEKAMAKCDEAVTAIWECCIEASLKKPSLNVTKKLAPDKPVEQEKSGFEKMAEYAGVRHEQ